MDLFRSVKRVCRGLAAPTAATTANDLPLDVLQYIFCLATSTWQAPGSCLATCVCKAWRTAAARCRGIRLLYHVCAAGSSRNLAFQSWLKQNSGQLHALTLSSSSSDFRTSSDRDSTIAMLLWCLSLNPVPGLHTLRVMDASVGPGILKCLLQSLPGLQCLQLTVQAQSTDINASADYNAAYDSNRLGMLPYRYDGRHGFGRCDDLVKGEEEKHQLLMRRRDRSSMRRRHLMPEAKESCLEVLQQSTSLQELYLEEGKGIDITAGVPGPPTLKRLSWTSVNNRRLALSHLTQLRFLQLSNEYDAYSSNLPPSLQALELQRQLTPWRLQRQLQKYTAGSGAQQQLNGRVLKLTAAVVREWDLCQPDSAAAIAQLTQLSALTVNMGSSQKVQAVVSAAGSMPSLRRLDLLNLSPQAPPLLFAAQLTGLTRLTLAQLPGGMDPGWAAELGRMLNLRWLSVGEELLAAGRGWLSGLKQLRVLVLQCEGVTCEPEQEPLGALSWLRWVWPQAQPAPQAQPPPLLMLGLKGIAGQQAASWRRRHSSQWLLISGCELLVGVDLDQLGAEAQQLAGWPEAVRQALA